MSVRHAALSFILVVSAILVGCGSVVDVTKTAKGFFQPTDPNNVEILKTVPTRAYEELGTVTANDFPVNDVAKMHNAIRSKAAALGADAVILTQEGILSGTWSSSRWSIGVAIHYKH